MIEHDEIKWDFSSFEEYEDDMDGSGTREGNVEGRISGPKFYREFKGCATLCLAEYEILEGTVTYEGTYSNDDI